MGELGIVSVLDLNFNLLKKYIVFCSELSNKIMNFEKDNLNIFLWYFDF